MKKKDLELKIKELKKALKDEQLSQSLDPEMLKASKEQMELEIRRLEKALNRKVK